MRLRRGRSLRRQGRRPRNRTPSNRRRRSDGGAARSRSRKRSRRSSTAISSPAKPSASTADDTSSNLLSFMALSKLTTGVAGLDILTHGGIPEGRATLVVGRSGTGKTILGLQLAAHFAQQGMPTLIVGIEETGEDLLET